MPSPIFETLQAELVPAAGPAVRSLAVLVFELAPDELRPTVQRLKQDFAFDLFLDVTAVDWPDQPLRFELVYHLASTRHQVRVRLKLRVPEAAPVVDSLRPLFGAAAYMERECHDMYGIDFRGHGDLRALLLYEGFVGHPLRKDYPKRREQPLVPYRSPNAPTDPGPT